MAAKKKKSGKKQTGKKKLPKKKTKQPAGSKKRKNSPRSKAEEKIAKLPKDKFGLPVLPPKFTARSKKSIEQKVYNKRSPIHGMGVFAKKKIKAGSYIGHYEGVPSVQDGTYVLWVNEEGDTWRGVDGKNELMFLNHSSDPNAEFDGNKLTAVKDIEPDEEITFHYGDEWQDVP